MFIRVYHIEKGESEVFRDSMFPVPELPHVKK